MVISWLRLHGPKSKTYGMAGVLALVILLAYGPALNAPFMLDDYPVLLGEGGVAHKSLAQLFSGYQNIFYRPVGHLWMMLCYHLFGDHPAPYHAANLVLFAGIVGLFFVMVRRVTGRQDVAFLTALLYALHPVNSMLVNYITASVISTFVLTLQASFLLLLKYHDGGGRKAYVFSLVFFGLALLSHEMSLIYPAYVFCLFYFIGGDRPRAAFLKTLPFLILAGAYFVLRLYIFSLKGMVTAVGAVMPVFSLYISSVMELIYWYVAKLLMPVNILFLWTVVLDGHYFPLETVRLAGILLVAGYLTLVRWRRGWLSFFLAVFVLGFLPCFWASYAHFPFCDPMIEPHWFYFSSIGFFVMAAAGILRLKDRWGPGPVWLTAGCMVFVLALLLQVNHRAWRSQEAYCRYWLALNPANATPFHGLGKALLDRGEGAQAFGYLRRAIQIARFDNEIMTADLGYAYFLEGDMERAMHWYAKALNIEPQYSRTYYYIGLVQMKAGRLDQAEASFRAALERYSGDPAYRAALAEAQARGATSF